MTHLLFLKKNDCDMFLNQLNSLHPSLKFTHEKEIDDKLLSVFLDVLVEKSNTESLTHCLPMLPSENIISFAFFDIYCIIKHIHFNIQ